MKYNTKLLFTLIILTLTFLNLFSEENIANSRFATFEYSDAYLETDNLPFISDSSNFSIEFIFKPTLLPKINEEIDIISGQTFTISLITDSIIVNNKIINNTFLKFEIKYLSNNVETSIIQLSSKRILANTWNHICCTFDKETAAIYINGQRENRHDSLKVNSFSGLLTGDKVIVAKNFTSKTNFYKGLLCELRFWNIDLKEDIIQRWCYREVSSSHLLYNHLIAHFPLTDIGASSISYINEYKTTSSGNYKLKNNGALTWEFLPEESYNTASYEYSWCAYHSKSDYDGVNHVAAVFHNNRFIMCLHSYEGIVPITGEITLDNKIENVRELRTLKEATIPGACCIYVGEAYIFGFDAPLSNEFYYPVVYYHVNHKNEINKIGQIPNVETNQKPVALVLSDTLYFFYVDNHGNIKGMYNTDYQNLAENNWKEISSQIVPENLKCNCDDTKHPDKCDEGGLAGCIANDRNGNAAIFLAFPNIKNSSINVYRFYGLGNIENEVVILANGVKRIAISQGMVSSINSGNILQIFYSYKRTDKLFGTSYGVNRIEYNINGKISQDYEYNSNNKINPAVFEYYYTSGNDIKRKIIFINNDQRVYAKEINNNMPPCKGSIHFLIWDSYKLRYRPDLDTELTALEEKLTKLIGVIEGPPPFVLNARDFPLKTPCYISFSNTEGSNIEQTEINGSVTNSSVKILGTFGYSYADYLSQSTKTSFETKTNFNSELIPIRGGSSFGWRIYAEPTITGQVYEILGPDDDFISTMMFISQNASHISFNQYKLGIEKYSPNPNDISSYLTKNRNIDFNLYDKHYILDFEYFVSGISEARFEQCSTITQEYQHLWGVGKDLTIDLSATIQLKAVKLNIPIIKYNYNAITFGEITQTLTTSNTEGIAIGYNTTGEIVNNDTIGFKARAYWLKYSDGQDNWWCPENNKGDRPWCITYIVKEGSFEIDSSNGLISDVNNNNKNTFFSIYPNPSSEYVNIHFDELLNNISNCYISNIYGKRVKTFNLEDLNTNHRLSWNSIDDYGNTVPFGTYICTLENDKKIYRSMFTIVR